MKAAFWDPHKWVWRSKKTGKITGYQGGYRFFWYRSWIIFMYAAVFWIDLILLPKSKSSSTSKNANGSSFEEIDEDFADKRRQKAEEAGWDEAEMDIDEFEDYYRSEN